MCIRIAKSCSSCRTYECVIFSREILEIVDSILPFSKVRIAKTSIKISQIACIGTAIIACNFDKTCVTCAVTVKGFIKLFGLEIFLSTCKSCACLLLTRPIYKLLIAKETCYNNKNCEPDCNASSKVTFSFLVAIIFIFFYYFRIDGRKSSNLILYIEINYFLFSFFMAKTINFARNDT